MLYPLSYGGPATQASRLPGPSAILLVVQSREEATGEQAYAAVWAGRWDTLRLLLHPYLRWTRADGHVVRGRTKVLVLLHEHTPVQAPRVTELRDGRIYRWDSRSD